MVLDTTLMGATSYPKLRMRQNIIYVIGRGSWGAVLTSNTGLDWQLFITQKADIDSFTPGNVLPDNTVLAHRARTFWGGFTTNPVEVYAMMISRQCPTYITVNESLQGDFGSGRRDGDSSMVIVKRRN